MVEETVTTREAVGVFDSYEELHETIVELETSGFGRRQINVLGSEAQRKERLGVAEPEPARVEDDPVAPREHIIGPEELGVAQGVIIGGGIFVGAIGALLLAGGMATGGVIAVMLLAGAAGGIIGALLAEMLASHYSRFFNKQVANGGLVLWVQTPSPQEEEKATVILKKHGAHDVHIHEMPMAA